MSRVVKNIIIWLLVISVILCIVFAFTFGITRVSGIASALSNKLVYNNGEVRPNLLKSSTASDMYNSIISGDGVWSVENASVNLSDDGFLEFTAIDADERITLDFNGNVVFNESCYYVFTFGFECISYIAGRTGVSLYIGQSTFTSDQIRQSDEGYFFSTFIAERDLVNACGDIHLKFYSDYDGLSTIRVLWAKLETSNEPIGLGFTGYLPYSEGSYDDGYEDGYQSGVIDGSESGYEEGYEDGYNEGYINGQESVRDIFNYSALNISHDPDNIYDCFILNGDMYSSYQNVYLGDIDLAFVPLSKLRYYDVDGGYYPIDLDLPDDGENIPNVADSEYYLEFHTVIEVGEWLLNNPTDYLCSYYITGDILPAVLVFSDLSDLSSFLSGAGVLYDEFYNDGFNDGYSSGDINGFDRGYGVGFNAGQLDANSGNYTFIRLIGAVIDAPIEAFKGLLDFDLLGVNMSSFVLAIMSLCVIIVIIRIILR